MEINVTLIFQVLRHNGKCLYFTCSPSSQPTSRTLCGAVLQEPRARNVRTFRNMLGKTKFP